MSWIKIGDGLSKWKELHGNQSFHARTPEQATSRVCGTSEQVKTITASWNYRKFSILKLHV